MYWMKKLQCPCWNLHKNGQSRSPHSVLSTIFHALYAGSYVYFTISNGFAIFLCPLFLPHLTVDPSANSVCSTFRISLEYDYFLPPPRLPSWLKPPESLTWNATIVSKGSPACIFSTIVPSKHSSQSKSCQIIVPIVSLICSLPSVGWSFLLWVKTRVMSLPQ